MSKRLRKKKLQTMVSTAMQGHNGASMSRQAFRNYNPRAGDAVSDDINDLPTLRARSRDLSRNSPIAGAAINTVVTNVIGTGLNMHLEPDAERLGMTDEEAARWKRETEQEWLLFCCDKNIDVTQCSDFYGLQDLALRSMLESGDVGILTPSLNRGSVYSLALQLIEADRISNRGYASDTASKVAGVTLNSNGAAVAYDIANRHPGSMLSTATAWTTVRAKGRTGRTNFIHLFEKRRPGQVRGGLYLAPVIEPLKQLSRYSEAELQAAVTSAAFALFTKMDPDAFDNLFDSEAQESYINNASRWDGGIDLDGPGKAVNLLPGEEISSPDLGRPNTNYDPFFLAILKQIGPALGMPFEVLIKHFSSSYSASRAALLDFWRFVRVRRDFMAKNFCEPVKELWFHEAVSRGRVRAPGFFNDPGIRKAYMRCKWIGDTPGSIDPEKEVKAATARVELGISTREKESAAFDGGDWEANARQLRKENEAFNVANEQDIE